MEIFDIHVPCRKCGELIPVGGNKECLACRLRSLNDPVFMALKMTNADRIRAMSDEELARMLMKAHDCALYIPFCENKDECFDFLDHGRDIDEEKCLRCMMDWLKLPSGGQI